MIRRSARPADGPGGIPALTLGIGLIALALAGCGGDGSIGPVPGLPPSVLEVSPEVLQRGDTAVLHGVNFSPRAGENRVLVDGGQARVLPPASDTRLRIRLDASNERACLPTRPVEISVTVGGRTGTSTHPLAPVPPLRISAGGDTSSLGGSPVRCWNLPEGDARYLVSVHNAARRPDRRASFRIRGQLGEGGSSSSARSSGERPVASGAAAAGPGADRSLAAILEGRRREMEVLRRGGEVLRRQARVPAPTAADAETAPDRSPPPEGRLVELRVPDLSQEDACRAFHEVTGRVVAVTSTVVVVEDTAGPLAGEMDATLRALAEEYESVMDPIIRENFGDPLAFGEHLDDDGHFTILFTPRVNELSGLLAFVWGGDFGSRASCASSDEQEIFYGLVPTRRGADPFSLATVDGWKRVMRSTTIHEVKHIAAFAEHRAGGAPRQEEPWLEEASAMVAEELYAREIFGYGSDQNTTYRQSLRCEVEPRDAACPDDPPLAVTAHFSFLRRYLRSVERRSPLGGDIAFLGGGWWLLRWALDRAPAGEAAFLRALTQETQLFGVENLEARTGRPFPAMLADWTLALGADDHPELEGTPADELTVPSWDVRSVYSGLNEARPQSFPEPFPLTPRERRYGDYLVSITGVPGGTASLLEISATNGGQHLLEILGSDGGPPPQDLGLSILRLR